MAELRRVPPGRAGKLWLTRRIHSGKLAADLLDRKLQVLRVAYERYDAQRRTAEAAWREAWRAADKWGLRGAVSGGARQLRLSAPAEPARLRVAWEAVMGVRYPTGAECLLPEPSPVDRGPGGAALAQATIAYREAVQAAAAYGAAAAACQVLNGEIVATRRRLRAINDRWIPRLEQRLDRLRQELDETEREESFRRHRALALH